MNERYLLAALSVLVPVIVAALTTIIVLELQ